MNLPVVSVCSAGAHMHIEVHDEWWWIHDPLLYSLPKAWDLISVQSTKEEDKQASVIFNKRSSVKGRKQNLSSSYATHKRNKFKCWAFEGKQWKKKQPLSIKKTPNQTKQQPKNPHCILTESFWRGKKGKIDEGDNHFAVSSTKRPRQNSLLAPKTTSLWSGGGSPVDIRMTLAGMGGTTSLPSDLASVRRIPEAAAQCRAYSSPGSSQWIQTEVFWQVGGYHGTKP